MYYQSIVSAICISSDCLHSAGSLIYCDICFSFLYVSIIVIIFTESYIDSFSFQKGTLHK